MSAGANKGLIAGIDVGGTFTDVFVLDQSSGEYLTGKVPSRRDDPAAAVADGLSTLLADMGALKTVVHGTTVGTNALLERRGARTGIITTRGFRDVLEMRRRDRPATWGLRGSFEPVVPRDRRIEVVERVLADGTVLEAVDPDAVRAAARHLLDLGAEALCIFFVNSYANDANERAALDAVREVWPNDHVTSAASILSEIREFERCSTGALNAYLQPVVGAYLARLQGTLHSNGFAGKTFIVQSNGGAMSVEQAQAVPVKTALSGPAAGVVAAARIAGAAGYANVITCDMGGTSFDVSLVADGQSALAAQTAVDFGMVIRSPMIEINTIGAGGGSIAWVDRAGLLQIGPESAGADPGPACYGKGNERPTVTDANLVLGRINADRPIGGALETLDENAARAALDGHVAGPLGLDPMAAAEAVIRVANARMAGAIRLVSIERGHDPRNFVAMPFGGGGALHIGALIRDVGLASALVPRFPGVTSALGCLMADMRHDRVNTLNVALDDVDPALVEADMRHTMAEGETILRQGGMLLDRIEGEFTLDMLYAGQTHTVSVPISLGEAGGLTREIIAAAFDTAYTRSYGRLLEGISRRIVSLRSAVIGRRPATDLSVFAAPVGGSLEDAILGERDVWSDGGWQRAIIYDRAALPRGTRVLGPAIIEQLDTTIFIDPGLAGEIDHFGNVVIREAAD
ncbi:MAG: hydantoinase/oxoprolinase family protein [Alphaproteobacteria bacterium]|jgi:N-methylhydantoinase A|nr:hydantoinase/oxoprolinase family protein [Alphaproteobacteria bacterium]